jgi:hypothetical protein
MQSALRICANSRREQVPLRSERSHRRPADRSDKQSLGNEQKNGIQITEAILTVCYL